MSVLTRGDLAEAAGMGVVAALRARDVPEHLRTRFELGRAAAVGLLGYVAARRAPSSDGLPDWAPGPMAAGAAVSTFATRRLTQRTEEALDARLAAWKVPSPRLVVAVLVAVGHLWTTHEERRRAEEAARSDLDG